MKEKLYNSLDFLSLVGTAGGPVLSLQGFLDKNYYFVGSGVILFGISIAGHYLINHFRNNLDENGLEKKIKK
ncbi:Uncharacterised protein [uncultured archaeon]|nr:Uncharacterised protein [uncultured archaeon]